MEMGSWIYFFVAIKLVRTEGTMVTVQRIEKQVYVSRPGTLNQSVERTCSCRGSWQSH
jgi:hypothetical protein